MHRNFALVFASLLALAGCGETVGEQAVAGGAVGAAGAIILDKDIADGAIIGAAGNIIYCQTNPGRC